MEDWVSGEWLEYDMYTGEWSPADFDNIPDWVWEELDGGDDGGDGEDGDGGDDDDCEMPWDADLPSGVEWEGMLWYGWWENETIVIEGYNEATFESTYFYYTDCKWYRNERVEADDVPDFLHDIVNGSTGP